jgi:hypothetical protein
MPGMVHILPHFFLFLQNDRSGTIGILTLDLN